MKKLTFLGLSLGSVLAIGWTSSIFQSTPDSLFVSKETKRNSPLQKPLWRISQNTLEDLQNTATKVSIDLPSNETIIVHPLETSQPEMGVSTTVLGIEGDKFGEVVITNFKGVVGGSVRRGNGESWEIKYQGSNRYCFVKATDLDANTCNSCSSKHITINGRRMKLAHKPKPTEPRIKRGLRETIRLNQPLQTKKNMGGKKIQTPVGQPKYFTSKSELNPLKLKYHPLAPTQNRRLDLLIIYTSGAVEKKYNGEDRSIKAHIYTAVKEVNRAFQHSRIVANINLVGIKKINVKGEKDIGADLGQIANSKTEAGALAKKWQIKYRADLVCYIPDAPGGGVAFLGPGAIHSVIAGAGGGVLAHEIGHNLGVTHDIIPGKPNGVFGYGVGHVFETVSKGKTNRLHTIMSYGNSSRGILRFSNPFVRYQGTRTGWLYHADCAAAINHSCQVNSRRSDSLPR